jgi:hypothetical protein
MNLKYEITLGFQEIKSMFEKAGLLVERRDKEYFFPAPNGITEREIIPTWQIQNPNTMEWEMFENVAQIYIQRKAVCLFLESTNLEIYDLFGPNLKNKNYGKRELDAC